MLGLGLLGLHDLGGLGLRWLAVDVVWAVAAGLGIGFGLGALVGKLVLYLRREHKEGFGLDDFLALGLIAVAYGAALLLHAYGFLAVFAAGLALRRIERRASGRDAPEEVHEMAAAGRAEEIATHPEKAPAYMAQAVLGFNEQMERLLEVGVVLLLGMMLADPYLQPDALWFVPLLAFVIRPLAAFAGLVGSGLPLIEKGLIGWFGVRGVGSVYYLAYALQHGVPESLARPLVGLTLTAVAASILAHGITVTPLMRLYERRRD